MEVGLDSLYFATVLWYKTSKGELITDVAEKLGALKPVMEYVSQTKC